MAADLLEEENSGMFADITRDEVQYEVDKYKFCGSKSYAASMKIFLVLIVFGALNDETFVNDGIQIEPFNLTKEREEGYFDAAGNYVEYMNENEIKDAWLDGTDANKSYVSSAVAAPNNEDEIRDLSSDDIGKIKRHIADTLEPGETVLQALRRRLKGTSNNKKEKMSAETKQLFDQLTEDAIVLLENMYMMRKKKLSSVKQGNSSDLGSSKSITVIDEDFFPNGKGNGSASAGLLLQ